MKLQLVKTAEGALCLTTKYEFADGITVLDRASNHPALPGVNYAISLFSASDVTLYVESSTIGRTFNSDLKLLGVAEGNAAAKKLGSWTNVQYSNSEVNVTQANKDKCIAFFVAVAEVFHCDEAAIAKIDDFIEWLWANRSEIEGSTPLAKAVLQKLPEYGWYYTVPVLRGSFMTAIDGAATAAEMLSLSEDLAYVQRAIGSIHQICHASILADLRTVTPALGFNTEGLRKLIPFIAETVYAAAGVKEVGFCGAILMSFIFMKCFQVESQNRVNSAMVRSYFENEWAAELVRFEGQQYLEIF